jgi:cytochrome d ubiquinol oxidase subunit I
LVASINETAQKNDWEIEMPWVLGLIGTRSVSKEIPGIREIKAKNRERIVRGMVAVNALETLRAKRDDAQARQVFEQHKADLGFGLLLKKYVSDVKQATPEMIERAVNDTVPRVTPMFWSFRIMVGLSFAMLALFALTFWSTIRAANMQKPWLLRWSLWMLPAPWMACELGWFIAEYGRQPWTIYGVLPTHLSVSTLSVNSLYGSLASFVGFYTVLLVVELFLMIKFARLGPGSLGTGRYQNEALTGEPHDA